MMESLQHSNEWISQEGPNGVFFSKTRELGSDVTITAILTGDIDNPHKVMGIVKHRNGSKFSLDVSPSGKTVAIIHALLEDGKFSTLHLEMEINKRNLISRFSARQEGCGKIDSYFWARLGIPDPRGKSVDIQMLVNKIKKLDFVLPTNQKDGLGLLTG